MTQVAPLFSGLAAPSTNGELAVYVVGPGFGESQVIVLPDGRTVVVDVCLGDGRNLTVDLLRQLNRPSIDLLVVTHSDLDHIAGLPELVREFRPARVWRFPAAGDLRALAAKWLRKRPGETRLAELARGLEALDLLTDQNIAVEVTSDTRSWPDIATSYVIHCLAPTARDQLRNRRHLDALLQWDGSQFELSEKVDSFLNGLRRSLGTRPNVLSVALAIEWGTVKVVLGGDVEAGDGSKESGWRGVVSLLKRRGKLSLVEGAHVVKVAHHGSAGAYAPEAWHIHTRVPRSTVAVVAPFSRGGVDLPERTVLSALHDHAERLVITSNHHGAHGRAVASGWTAAPKVAACPGPLAVLALTPDGSVDVRLGSDASAFVAQ